MKLKKALLCTGAVLSSLAILLSVAGRVNHCGKYSLGYEPPAIQADGNPLPPFPPTPTMNQLVADGNPLPPFPPTPTTNQLVADGNPLPPFPPTRTTNQLVADGNPLPPFPPTPTTNQLVADGNPLPPFPPTGQMLPLSISDENFLTHTA
jgi:hypothetical protein